MSLVNVFHRHVEHVQLRDDWRLQCVDETPRRSLLVLFPNQSRANEQRLNAAAFAQQLPQQNRTIQPAAEQQHHIRLRIREGFDASSGLTMTVLQDGSPTRLFFWFVIGRPEQTRQETRPTFTSTIGPAMCCGGRTPPPAPRGCRFLSRHQAGPTK